MSSFPKRPLRRSALIAFLLILNKGGNRCPLNTASVLLKVPGAQAGHTQTGSSVQPVYLLTCPPAVPASARSACPPLRLTASPCCAPLPGVARPLSPSPDSYKHTSVVTSCGKPFCLTKQGSRAPSRCLFPIPPTVSVCAHVPPRVCKTWVRAASSSPCVPVARGHVWDTAGTQVCLNE